MADHFKLSSPHISIDCFEIRKNVSGFFKIEMPFCHQGGDIVCTACVLGLVGIIMPWQLGLGIVWRPF